MRSRSIVCSIILIAAAAPSPASAGTPAFDALLANVTARQVGTVEDAIATLPVELRSNYTLAFGSRSLQGSSYLNPRAILFNRDATFIVTFNGEPSQRGYYALETMEFDPSANRFVYRELAFTADGDPAGVRASAPNPARCIACHGSPARPIWDVSPTWPGMYGERYRHGLSPPEATGMRAFLAQQPRHPRYRQLIDAARFADRDTYVPSSHAAYSGAVVEPPNERLSALLATLNTRAVLADLAAAAGFDSHLPLLVAAARGDCGAPEDFYPESLQPRMRQELVAFRALAAPVEANQSFVKAKRLAGPGASSPGGGAPGDPLALRFVAERSLRLPTGRWTTAFEKGTYDMTAPDAALTLADGLSEIAAARDPALRALATLRSYRTDDPYCESLRARSRAALGTWYAAHPLEPAPWEAPRAATAVERPTLVDRCISCHTTDAAPALPFDDPARLASTLVRGAYPRGRLLDEILYRLTPDAGTARMPRGIAVTSAEQHELERYFLGLAAPGGRRGDGP